MSELELIRGDSAYLDIVSVEPDGSPCDLSAASVWWTAKWSPTDTDARAVMQKTIGDGITLTDALEGLAEVRIDPADWDGYSGTRPLHWDLQVVVPASPVDRVVTQARGTLKVIQDITRAVT